MESTLPSTVKADNEKFCSECGDIINIKAEICPKCGVRQAMPIAKPHGPSKDKTTTAILALLLGWLGVHKFYLGENGIGIIYLLFFWTYIPGLISLVEFFYFLFMTKEDFDQKYNPL